MLISVLTGILAGALHVIGGADHLVVMAPSGLRHPRFALRSGLAWGIGHSAGVLILSTFAIFIKDFVNIAKMSLLAEFCVGLTLLIVGGLAIRNSLGLNIHSHNHKHKKGHIHKHIHIHFLGKTKHFSHHHAATSLGILHGLAGTSHLLAVIPALALPPINAFIYMGAYLIGSIITMGIFLLVISLAYIRIGQRALPVLVGSTGLLSVVTGIIWIQKTPISSFY